MARVALHVSPRLGPASVTEQVEHLVDGLWVLSDVVPEVNRVVRVGGVRLGISLLGVDEVRELGRVSQEEDGSVVVDPVHVSFLGPELDGESSRVSSYIWRTRLATDGGESDRDVARGTILEDLGLGEMRNTLGDLECSVSSTTLGVDDSLWNSLSVKVREQVDQVVVVGQEERTLGSYSLRSVRVSDGSTVGGGVDSTVFVGVLVKASNLEMTVV